MVKLSILSYKGNSNSRFYPHSGYLGLTPVKVEGVVRTALDEDKKPLQASSVQVSVSCIECRLGRVGIVHSNVLVEYSQTLWSKSASVEYDELGDGDFPFKIIIPIKTLGHSYLNFQDYRVLWRVEAVINHAPIFGVGTRKHKSYDIPLVRYDANVPSRDYIPSPTRMLVTTKPRAPVIQYQLVQPNNPVGPLDIVTISLLLRPADPNVVIRSASLVVERRIELSETTQMPAPGRASACPTPTSSPPPTESEGSSGSTIRGFDHNRESSGAAPAEASTSTAHLQIPRPNNMSQSFTSLASTYTTESASEQRPLIPLQTDLPPKTISLTVAHVDSSGAFQKDDTGTYAKSLTLQWPASKSNSHWAMGETMQTEMIKIRFLAHVKIIVSSPSTGTETVELEERELFLVATNESERKLAITKYTDATARSKSKSPRRSKASPSPQTDGVETPQNSSDPVPSVPPIASPTDNRDFAYGQIPTSSERSSAPPSHSPRRPHTSAGPRDRAYSRHHDAFRERDRDRFNRDDEERRDSTPPLPSLRPLRRPESALPSSVVCASSPKTSRSSTLNPKTKEISPSSTYPYPPAHARRSSRETVHHVVAPPSSGFASDPGTVRAWEEELARIERTSRRVSVNLGFNLKRFRPRSMRPKTPSSSVTSESP